MFSESAEFYDVIYGAFKDYPAEARQIAMMVRGELPDARAVLDVACGTGEHVMALRTHHGFDVDGLDLDAGLLAVARRKVPAAMFFQADMSAFALERRYDVVLCLFSSIGYLRTLDRVTAALRCFRHHLNAGGMIVVEPWFGPGTLRLGRGDTKRGEAAGIQVARTSFVTESGRLSTIQFDYEMVDAHGTRHTSETHALGLFTPDEMLACFRDAGLSATFDPNGLTGRGLYVARVAA